MMLNHDINRDWNYISTICFLLGLERLQTGWGVVCSSCGMTDCDHGVPDQHDVILLGKTSPIAATDDVLLETVRNLLLERNFTSVKRPHHDYFESVSSTESPHVVITSVKGPW